MKPDRSILTTLVVCLVAVIVALYARTYIYSVVPASTMGQSDGLGQDPFDGGRITIHYHERPPYYITRGKGVGGIIGDRITFVFDQARIPMVWKKTPARRQLEIIRKNDRREGAAGWFRTPSREASGKFSWPIYQDRPTIALTRANEQRILSGGRLEDLLADSAARLLRKEDYSYGTLIDGMIERYRPRQLVTPADNTGLLDFIHTGRADYFLIAPEEAEHLFARTKLPRSDFRTVTFTDLPAGNRRYILFSRRVESTTIERLNRHIRNYGIDLPGNRSVAE